MKSAREENLVTRYLLGQTTEEESSRIEDGYFRSPEYHEEILALEEELIARYLREDILPSERLQFENHFLASDRRRAKYELTRDLAAYLTKSYQAAPVESVERNSAKSGRSWFRELLSGASGIANWRMAGAMATLCVLTVFLLLLVMNQRQPGDRTAVADNTGMAIPQAGSSQTPDVAPDVAIARPPSENGASATAIPSGANIPASLQDPRKNHERSNELPAPVIVRLSEGRDPVRDLAKVRIPSRANRIRLQLPLDQELDHPRFEAVVKSYESGNVIWRRGQLTATSTKAGRTLRLTIPSRLFEKAVYVISVNGLTEEGGMKMVGEGFFRVNRP